MAIYRSPDRKGLTPAGNPVLANRRDRYDPSMTKVAKIAVSLPQEQVEQVRAAVSRGEAASVSGYVSAALAGALARGHNGGLKKDGSGEDSLAELVEELVAEYGEPSADAYAWADAALARSDPN
jgi:Arc/MetJ-type ribon-helix-helix transcriptional regulator